MPAGSGSSSYVPSRVNHAQTTTTVVNVGELIGEMILSRRQEDPLRSMIRSGIISVNAARMMLDSPPEWEAKRGAPR